MNSFENIISGLFRADGYWTAIGYRVEMTRGQKRQAGKPSMARPELDILAYKGKTNELIWVECKSYLDSRGVTYASFTESSHQGYKRFKSFNDDMYREVISSALIDQVVRDGLTQPNPTLHYCLVAGKVQSPGDSEKIAALFSQRGWMFYDIAWIYAGLKSLAESRYEDDITMMVAKILQAGEKLG